mgnify:CR=1 FL=1|jgi:hypothetical protein
MSRERGSGVVGMEGCCGPANVGSACCLVCWVVYGERTSKKGRVVTGCYGVWREYRLSRSPSLWLLAADRRRVTVMSASEAGWSGVLII